MGLPVDAIDSASSASNDTNVTADPISAVAKATGDIFKSIFGFLSKGAEVDLAQKKVDNTKELLKIEQEKGETAEALAQIALLSKKLDLQITELNNAKELEKQKQTGSIATLLFVLIFLVFIVFLVLKFLKPAAQAAQMQPQTILLQE